MDTFEQRLDEALNIRVRMISEMDPATGRMVYRVQYPDMSVYDYEIDAFDRHKIDPLWRKPGTAANVLKKIAKEITKRH